MHTVTREKRWTIEAKGLVPTIITEQAERHWFSLYLNGGTPRYLGAFINALKCVRPFNLTPVYSFPRLGRFVTYDTLAQRTLLSFPSPLLLPTLIEFCQRKNAAY